MVLIYIYIYAKTYETTQFHCFCIINILRLFCLKLSSCTVPTDTPVEAFHYSVMTHHSLICPATLCSLSGVLSISVRLSSQLVLQSPYTLLSLVKLNFKVQDDVIENTVLGCCYLCRHIEMSVSQTVSLFCVFDQLNMSKIPSGEYHCKYSWLCLKWT